jgi:uncharacterized RDD family membrane protein YckC
MSSQTPGGDPPPTPPTQPTPDADAPTTAEPRPTGIISAAPVGWTGPTEGPAAQPDQPVVAWAPPAAAAAAPATVVEGMVIAGVFSRVVAYTIDLALLLALNISVGALLGTYEPGASMTTTALLAGLALVAVDAVYFIGLWRSGWQATVGMRLLQLRVVRAVDAATLPLNPAAVRWLAVSGVLSIVSVLPTAASWLGLFGLVWIVVLLVTTATDRLHQGLHDRWAGSVVVQPAPGGSGAAVVGCLVMIFLLFLIPFVVVLLNGDAFRELVTNYGNSI